MRERLKDREEGTGAMAGTIRADVLIVGGGAAALSAAYSIATQARKGIIVLEKARDVGCHSISGAIVKRGIMERLLGGQRLPFGNTVSDDKVVLLTERRHLTFPAPPPIRSRGSLMVSYGQLCRHLAGLCEAQGVEVHSELAAEEPVIEGGRVVGVKLLNGETVLADCVVLAEGSCGLVTGKVIDALALRRNGRHYDSYALGMKVAVVTDDRSLDGAAYHTMGYPLDKRHFGGGFVYGIDGRIHIGLVVGLEYDDGEFDVHETFGKFLEHPFIRQFVQRGQISGFGAKVINEGGYHAMPALVGEGVAIVGEAGGLVNAMNLKGIDLAIRSGMEAGKVIALGKPLSEYPRALGETPEFKAFQRARNVHQYFTYSMPEGMVATGLAMFTRGLLPPRIAPRKAGLVPHSPGSQGPRKAALCSSLVHLTRVSNRGPEHISVDETMCLKCLRDYGQPCARFCPAGVYEAVPETGRVLVHAEDCIHCRACAVKDPYGSINWNAPVDGPRYVMM